MHPPYGTILHITRMTLVTQSDPDLSRLLIFNRKHSHVTSGQLK